jgi:lysozyme
MIFLENILTKQKPDPPVPLTERQKAMLICEPFLDEVEGCVLTAYHGKADRPGVWTIGTGFTTWKGAPVREGLVITQTENDTELAIALAARADVVDRYAPPGATAHQRAALYSFAWNEGTHAFQISAIAARWRGGEIEAAAEHFAEWVYAAGRRVQGLVNRRAKERALFLTKD